MTEEFEGVEDEVPVRIEEVGVVALAIEDGKFCTIWMPVVEAFPGRPRMVVGRALAVEIGKATLQLPVVVFKTFGASLIW